MKTALLPLLTLAAALFWAAPPPLPERAFAGADPVILAAGDIATCGLPGDEATGALLDTLPHDAILIPGDLAYEDGTAQQFNDCYDPNWGGEHKAATYPSPGNHEYHTPAAAGYYAYWGGAAGDPAKGYYSFDLGAWHIIAINSNCSAIGGCGAGSPQELWLRLDLATHPSTCTLAYWHHPRFSSGPHGNSTSMQPIWQALYDYGADVVLSGHDHDYERFAPQTPAGVADPTFGIREFVVGTGGRSLYAFGAPKLNSEVRDNVTWGVISMTLHPTGYDWQFVPAPPATFTDSGSSVCHGPTQSDADSDGWLDAADNCPSNANNGQQNNDRNFIDLPPSKPFDDATAAVSDTLGDACDADDDNDGITDIVETAGAPCASATAATNPMLADTDGDRRLDGAECALGSDPASSSSVPPFAVTPDADADGVPNLLDPNDATNQSDGDAVSDNVEFRYYNTNLANINTDADSCGDAREIASLDANQTVNAADLGNVASAFGPSTNPNYIVDFDVDKNGTVNAADLGFVAGRFGACP